MKIRVTIDPRLLPYMPDSPGSVHHGEREVMEGTTIDDLMGQFSFSEGAEILTIVNDACCMEKGRPIEAGDHIVVLPLIVGG